MVFAFTSSFQPMRLVVVALAVVAACLFVANGALLTFRPDLFLRFYDFQNPGDYVAKTAGWRKDIYNVEYKLLGVALVAIGVFILGLIAKLLV